jgi:hypothetical protein
MAEPPADATIRIDSPERCDVDALAKSTIRSLDLLIPWCQPSDTYVCRTSHSYVCSQKPHSPKLRFASEVVQQAHKYAEAIDLSVVAAQKAFTVAEEAISLGELIPTSTPDEHQSYLVDMLELAREGRETATKTLETFRDVRTDVESVGRLFFLLLSRFQPYLRSALAES